MGWLAIAGLIVLPIRQAVATDSTSLPTICTPTAPPASFSLERAGKFGGVGVSYTVIAGETYLKGDDDEPRASIFSTAYVSNDGAPRSNRPVVFLFNGGPGSSSVWLHLGAFGPRRVVVPSDATSVGSGPYELIENTETILDVADLVFIDPVGTGFSRALGRTSAKEYFSLQADARSIAEFISRWLSVHQRSLSPKYVLGESYGTLRAGAVTGELDHRYGIALNGVILISSVTDFSAVKTTPGNEIAYIVNMPSMAAAAWYHNKIPNKPVQLEPFLEAARQFARTDFAQALLQGDRLGAQERASVRKRLSEFTGLPEDYLERVNLRVGYVDFVHELLRAENKVIGFADMRYTATANSGTVPLGDPSSFAITPAFTAAADAYFRSELRIDMGRPYRVDTEIDGWQYAEPETVYVNTASQIGASMQRYPNMRVLLASGYYDWNTTFFGSEYGLAHSGLDPARVVIRHYFAGHMMYLHGPSRTQLLADVREFINAGRPPLQSHRNPNELPIQQK